MAYLTSTHQFTNSLISYKHLLSKSSLSQLSVMSVVQYEPWRSMLSVISH